MKSYFDTIISLWRAENVLFHAYFLHKYQLYSYRNKKKGKYGTDSIKVLDKIGNTDYNKNMESIPQ